MTAIDKYIAYMTELVTNPKHGYDQIHRWGPDYDCSSSIISSVQNGAGIPVKDKGATYTGNMRAAFKKCGFVDIPFKKGMTLVRGDILLNEIHHTAMYIGDNKVAQFSINEKGKTTGGASGDQTGRESSIGPYYVYSKGWDYVLRYPEKEVQTVEISMPELRRGMQCAEVGTAQVLLNRLGYRGENGLVLVVDHIYGKNFEFAIKNFQKACGMNDDGICGRKTWTALLKANY